ncbi:MAG: hypothetical protein IPM29_05800 [Planctomycetes bacterium]|nr:hypothetical protein [Planctomycetota bacterium]
MSDPDAIPIAATPTVQRCLAGVDEAGLGPLLGPLVVAGVTMAGPAGVDPWRALGALVTRGRPGPSQLQVADSKKVKHGPLGLARLERTALAFWTAWTGDCPTTVDALLAACGADRDRLRRCPWYADLALPLPLAADRAGIELTAHLLRRNLREHTVALHRIAIRPLDVEEYNASIARTDNKSTTHFETYAEVLAALCVDLPPGSHLLADRCGGRMHYVEPLRAALPDCRVRRLRESPELSTYRLERDGGELRITFAAGGEERAFPTALASCFAKYVRELMMAVLNRWFADRVPGLRPTAGYWVDGTRFLTDVAPLVDAERLPLDHLRRSR